LEQATVIDMVIDVCTDDETAIMYKPVGPDVKVPTFVRRGIKVYMLLSKDPDGRACYKLR
jgi:hypothetical protein